MGSKTDAFMHWSVLVKYSNTFISTNFNWDYSIKVLYEWMKNLWDFIQNYYLLQFLLFFFFFPKIFQRLPDWFPFYDMDTTLALHLGCFEPEYQDSYWFQDFAPTTANEKIMIYWLPCVFNYFAVWLFHRGLL